MRYVFYCLLPSLIGCSAVESMSETPADPANPAGPSQLDATVETAAGLVTAINPVFGGILAAAGLAGYGAWKVKKNSTPPSGPGV